MKITKQRLKQIIKEELGRALKARRPALNEVSQAAQAAYDAAILKWKEEKLEKERAPWPRTGYRGTTAELEQNNRARAARTMDDIDEPRLRDRLELFILSARENDQIVTSGDVLEFINDSETDDIYDAYAETRGIENVMKNRGKSFKGVKYLDIIMKTVLTLRENDAEVNMESVRSVANYARLADINPGIPSVDEFASMTAEERQALLNTRVTQTNPENGEIVYEGPMSGAQGVKDLLDGEKSAIPIGHNFDLVTGKSIGDVAIDAADTAAESAAETGDTGEAAETADTGDTGDPGETGEQAPPLPAPQPDVVTDTGDSGAIKDGKPYNPAEHPEDLIGGRDVLRTQTGVTTAQQDPPMEYAGDVPDFDFTGGSDPFDEPVEAEPIEVEEEPEELDINEIIRESFKRFL